MGQNIQQVIFVYQGASAIKALLMVEKKSLSNMYYITSVEQKRHLETLLIGHNIQIHPNLSEVHAATK